MEAKPDGAAPRYTRPMDQALLPLSLILSVAALVACGIIAARGKRLVRRARRAEVIAHSAQAQLTYLRSRLYSQAAEFRLTQAKLAPAMPIVFRSQFGEDMFLFDLFQGRSTGFFIEVGAYDGLSMSVSYAFEAMGWTGLLVEPTPARAEACRVNRPRSRVVHAALGAPGQPPTATFLVGATRARASEVSGGDMLSHLQGSSEHASRSDSARRFTSITVPLMTLSEALGDVPGPIDFASIDVEGGEWALIRGLDLSRHQPRVLLVEQGEGQSGGDAPRITGHLRANGYEYIGAFMGSGVFVRGTEAALLARARQLLLACPPASHA